MDIRKIGLKRANPLARKDNNTRLSECTDALGCRDQGSQTLADTVTVTGIVYDGVTYTLPTPTLVTDTVGIQDAIAEILGTYEVYPVVDVTYGTALAVTHVGEGSLTSVVTSGTDVTLTRVCDVEIRCDYVFSESATFDLNGTEVEIDGASTSTTVRTDILAVLVGVGFKTVTVTEDPDGTFNVAVVAIKGFTLEVDEIQVLGKNCKKDWVIPDDLA